MNISLTKKHIKVAQQKFICDNKARTTNRKDLFMSNYQSHNHLGEQFKHAVSDAVNNGNFEELNHLVTDTVTDVIANTGRQVKKMTDQFQNNIPNVKTTIPSFSKRKKKAVPETRKVGQTSAILSIIFGSMGIILLCFSLLFTLLSFAIDVFFSPKLLILQIALIIGCTFVTFQGLSKYKRLTRMKRYVSLCDGNMYINIRELALQTNKSADYVLKDVKKMLKLGFFPQGHLDEKETCLMLDDETYREYLKINQQRKVIAQEEAAKKATLQKKKQAQSPELERMMKDGQTYIQKLHEMNELLPGEVISNKLYRMENLLKEIFEQLEEDPSQMPNMQKLMEYYLPTTIKLLEAYKNFNDVTVPNNDIIKAKSEIEKTVDTINEAFTELLNKLFQSTVFDVTTDAQVLQTMLAKEGLTKNQFSEDKK